MGWRHGLVGAIGGAVGTLVLTQVFSMGNDRAGEAIAARASSSDDGPVQRVVQRETPRAGASSDETIAHLQDRVAELEEQLATSEFEGAISRGQLSAHRGDPVPWPEGLPEIYDAAAYEQVVRDTFEGRDDVVLEGVDCNEFPCLVTLLAVEGGTEDALQQAAHGFVQAELGEGVGMGMQVAAFKRHPDDPAARYGTFWAVPRDQMDPDLMKRASYRADSFVRDLEPEAGGAGEVDVDIQP